MLDAIDARIQELTLAKSADPKGWRHKATKPVHKYTDGPEDGLVAEARALKGALDARSQKLGTLI
jgi:hypothetical protein